MNSVGRGRGRNGCAAVQHEPAPAKVSSRVDLAPPRGESAGLSDAAIRPDGLTELAIWDFPIADPQPMTDLAANGDERTGSALLCRHS